MKVVKVGDKYSLEGEIDVEVSPLIMNSEDFVPYKVVDALAMNRPVAKCEKMRSDMKLPEKKAICPECGKWADIEPDYDTGVCSECGCSPSWLHWLDAQPKKPEEGDIVLEGILKFDEDRCIIFEGKDGKPIFRTTPELIYDVAMLGEVGVGYEGDIIKGNKDAVLPERICKFKYCEGEYDIEVTFTREQHMKYIEKKIARLEKKKERIDMEISAEAEYHMEISAEAEYHLNCERFEKKLVSYKGGLKWAKREANEKD